MMENKNFSKYSTKQIGLILRILTDILKNNSYDCHEFQGLRIFWDNLSYKISARKFVCMYLYPCIYFAIMKKNAALETTL